MKLIYHYLDTEGKYLGTLRRNFDVEVADIKPSGPSCQVSMKRSYLDVSTYVSYSAISQGLLQKLLEISSIIPPAMDVVNFGDKNGPKGGVIFEPYDYGPLEDSYPRQSKMENVEVHDMEVPFMVPTELLAIQRIP
ncbi:hypothetical protein Tco_0415419 [Tanacetum coccineum]